MAWCGSTGARFPASTRPWPGCGARVSACSFATNNSAPTRAELHKRLGHCGITVDDGDLLSSADVAAGLLATGSRAVVLAADGVLEALAARGVARRARGTGRRRGGGHHPPLHLRRRGRRRCRGTGRGTLHRHQRGSDLSHPRRARPRRRRHPRRGGHGGRGGARGGGQAATGRRPRPSPPGCPTGSCGPWWGTGPPPTGHWRRSSASPSPWCCPASPGRGTSRPDAHPAAVAPDLAALVRQALDGALNQSAC